MARSCSSRRKSQAPHTCSRLLTSQRENDGESALMHFRARSYDPRIGRFSETDPVLRVRTHEHYSYARNGPTNAVDPRGTQTQVAITQMAAAGASGTIRFDVYLWFSWPQFAAAADFGAAKTEITSRVGTVNRDWAIMLGKWEVEPVAKGTVTVPAGIAAGWYGIELHVHWGFDAPGMKTPPRAGWHWIEYQKDVPKDYRAAWVDIDSSPKVGVARKTGDWLVGYWRQTFAKDGLDGTHELAHTVGLRDDYRMNKSTSTQPDIETADFGPKDTESGYTLMSSLDKRKLHLNAMQIEIMLAHFKPGGHQFWTTRGRGPVK